MEKPLAGRHAADQFSGPHGKRLSTALRRGKHWKPFQVRLCPSLAGIELLKDGGFLTAELDLKGRRPRNFNGTTST